MAIGLFTTRDATHRPWLVATAAIWLVLGGAAGPAAAAEEEESVNEQILEILRESGEIDEGRYRELKRQAEQEQAARSGTATPAVNSQEGWDAGWKNGFYLNKQDGTVKLKFGGRIQLDGAVMTGTGMLERIAGANVDGTGVEFRRARLFFAGSVYEHAIFKAQYDFAANGTTEFKDLWVGLKQLPGLGPDGRVRFGHLKEPFSIDELTSSKYITFLERALPNVFAPGRNTGILVERTFADRRIYVGGGGFANVNNFGDAFNRTSNYNLTARVTGLPVYQDDGRRLVHVGVAYSHLFRGRTGVVRYRQRPEAHLAPRLVDTALLPMVSGVDIVGVELASVCGPLHVQGEFIGNNVNFHRTAGRGTNAWLWGVYGQVGWFLTGESRAYKPAVAAFARTKPKHNFSLENGTWGAWELAGRLSHLDLDDRSAGVRGGTLSNLTAGLNWHLFPNLRLMTNYVYSWRHGAGNASIVQGRVSFDF